MGRKPQKTRKLTNDEALKLATDAHRLPEGTIGRQYQIVLNVLIMEWFLSLSSRQRGEIVEAGMIAIASQQENKE